MLSLFPQALGLAEISFCPTRMLLSPESFHPILTFLCRTVQEVSRSASGVVQVPLSFHGFAGAERYLNDTWGLTHAYLSIGRALERKMVDGRWRSSRSSERVLERKTAVLGKLVVCVKVYRIVLVGDFLVKQE